MRNLKKDLLFAFSLVLISNSIPLFAQSNSSNVTNNTAPSASSTTTGGTSINYQTNQSFSNDVGFGPGYICRTPSINLTSSYAGADSTNWAALGDSGTYADNISASLGLVVPFGSGVMDSCKTVAKQVAIDKEISTQLSMIRACASLNREGIIVDANKFPLLSECVIKPGQPNLISKNNISNNKQNTSNTKKNKEKKVAKKSIAPKVPRLID